MKHLFVINPIAGKGKGYDIIMPKIKESLSGRDIDYEIYVSGSPEDTVSYTREWASRGDPVRVYACGGDGTLYNVINGVYGYENAEFAAVPLGSGNDFVRFFGTKEGFTDIDAQIDGTAVKIDGIRCGDHVAINQCSMGMDAEVCAKQRDFKKLPFLSGESAYTASLLYCLKNKRQNRFTITIDDGEPIEKDVLFAFCGNSRFYGGGYMAGPFAVPDDGLLDFSIIETMKLPRLLREINNYKAGRHYKWKETTYLRGKRMTVRSEKQAAVNIDGECEFATECTFEVLPGAFNFVIPTTSSYIEDRRSGRISDKIGV